MNIELSDAYNFCNSVITLMRETDALEPGETAGEYRGVWRQDRRNGISVYLRSDARGSRVEVWRKRRMFLATCSHGFEKLEVQEYAPGSWESEIMQLGHLASLPTRRPWREGAVH